MNFIHNFHFDFCVFILPNSKPLGQLKGSVDHMIAVHAKLVDVGGLHPDSEDELNMPISSADKRASWSRAKSRSRTESVASSMSNSTAFKVKNNNFVNLMYMLRMTFEFFCI